MSKWQRYGGLKHEIPVLSHVLSLHSKDLSAKLDCPLVNYIQVKGFSETVSSQQCCNGRKLVKHRVRNLLEVC